ncbi:MAG: type 2 isopentenyl-diphosphate Delta-isomerase [Thaumarchaeota archaeon]|nr:type 2 isopentenyl-diphosphate Delta-isomerase [Nitrososphaerota archaeon]
MCEDTPSRKRDHLKISLGGDVSFEAKTTWLEYVELVHQALPELDFDKISTEATFLRRRFGMPLIIEAMTGGIHEAAEINGNLAEAAERFSIPMGVGSQRAALADRSLEYTYRVARERGPNAFLIANLSGVQLVRDGVEAAEKAVEMIEANALAIHLNALQELVQPEGTPSFQGVLTAIGRVAEKLDVPVIVKEIGCGMSAEVARSLEATGVEAIEVAGAGGTCWTRIEMLRATESDEEKEVLAKTFLEWGIPTAASIIEVSSTVNIEVIASGGLRTGLDIAKALSIGADMAGIAHPLLKPAVNGVEEVTKVLSRLRNELRAAMFLTGCGDVKALKESPHVIFGPLLEWVRQRLKRD